jgi:hypothetical protein
MTGWRGLTSLKNLNLLAVFATAFLPALAAETASAAAYKVTSVISLPGGQKLGASGVDIGIANPQLSLYALTDRTNSSVDVIDTTTNTVMFQTKGFLGTGVAPLTADRGPNGVIFVDNKEIWAGDGDNTVKVIDLGTRTITHTIPLGGTGRGDELCHDPVNHVVVIAADHDTPFPTVSFISTATYSVIKKISLNGAEGIPRATNGIEQCQWNPRTGLIYLAVPEVSGPGNDSTPGVVLVLNGATQRIVAAFLIPLDACAGPQGLIIGPAPQILLGCSNNGKSTPIIDERDGSVIATFPINGNDEVTFDSTDNHYFLAASNASPPQLGIIDAITLKTEPSIPTGAGNHSVAADASTGQVYLPVVNTSGATLCSAFGGVDANGCIAVITSSGAATTIVSAVAPTARTTTPGVPVTGFATIINSGPVTAKACSIALPSSIPADFLYRTTNPANNAPTGTPNTAVDIPANKPAGQTFYFEISPTAAFTQDIPLQFVCANSDPAPSVGGLNTFLLSSSNPQQADMLSITDTASKDGFVVVPGTTGTGQVVAASMDIGAAGTVTFTPTDTPVGQMPRNLPLDLTICQTDATARCMATAGPSVTVNVTNGQVLFFSIFVKGRGQSVALNPAFNRVFLVAMQGNNAVGEASVAVKMTTGAATASAAAATDGTSGTTVITTLPFRSASL